jgi:hypothetical protein
MSQTATTIATLGAPVIDRQPITMSNDFTFRLKSIRFDEDYRPSDNTRITTNFAISPEARTARRTCATPYG